MACLKKKKEKKKRQCKSKINKLPPPEKRNINEKDQTYGQVREEIQSRQTSSLILAV